MNIRILPKWVGMLAMLFVPLLSFAQTALPWQQSGATIEEVAKAQQNPGVSKQLQTASDKPNSPQQPVKDTRMLISRAKLNEMSPEKQAIFTGNPDMYLIVDHEVVIPKEEISALALVNMELEVQNRILQRTDIFEVKKAVIDNARLHKFLPAQQAFIMNHSEFYEFK